MSVPSAVKRQIDEADQIQKDLIAGKTVEAEPTGEPVKTELEEVSSKPAEKPASEDEKAKKAEPTKEPSELELLREEVARSNKRLSDFKKMYDTAVTEGRVTIDSQRSEIENLTSQLSKKQVDNEPGDYGEVISKARDDYGDDLVNSIISQVRSEVRPPAQPDAKPSERPDLPTAKPVPASQDIWGYLKNVDSQVDWHAVNKEEGFLDWLGIEDFSGGTRHQILSAAMSEGRYTDAAQLFIEWDAIKREQRIEKARAASDGISDIMPDSNSNSGEPVPEGRSFTWDQYQQIKTDIATGKYGKEEALSLSQELEGAHRAGRIK